MNEPNILREKKRDHFDHIDGSLLLGNAGGDPELVRELLGIFVRTFAADIERLNTAVQAQNIEQIRHLLHRTKGSLQILGANATVDMIEEISGSLGSEIGVEQFQALHTLFQRFDAILQEAITQAEMP